MHDTVWESVFWDLDSRLEFNSEQGTENDQISSSDGPDESLNLCSASMFESLEGEEQPLHILHHWEVNFCAKLLPNNELY